MKSRDTLVRLKQFQVDDKRRRIAQLQTMIAEFTRMTNDLDRENRDGGATRTTPIHRISPIRHTLGQRERGARIRIFRSTTSARSSRTRRSG